MNVIFEMIFVDKSTKRIYRTPNHNDDETKDDYHSSKRKSYKKEVLKRVAGHLRKQYGDNPDIAIVDGIIHIDPMIEEYKGKGTIPTGVEAIEHFVPVLKLFVDTSMEVANEMEVSFRVIKSQSHILNADIDESFQDILLYCLVIIEEAA